MLFRQAEYWKQLDDTITTHSVDFLNMLPATTESCDCFQESCEQLSIDLDRDIFHTDLYELSLLDAFYDNSTDQKAAGSVINQQPSLCGGRPSHHSVRSIQNSGCTLSINTDDTFSSSVVDAGA